MYEEIAGSRLCTFGVGAAMMLVFFVVLAPNKTNAAVCEGGQLKNIAGGTAFGTCSGEEGIEVACSGGIMIAPGSSTLGTPSRTVGTCLITTGATLSRDGAFDCTSSRFANVGATMAIGGVFVPVNDAAVTLNTGYLIYKECVLDRVSRKLSEATRARVTASVGKIAATGRNGLKMWVENQETDLRPELNKIFQRGVRPEHTNLMCAEFRTRVTVEVARSYAVARNAQDTPYVCTAPQSNETTWASFYAMANPANTPPGAFFGLQRKIGNEMSSFAYNQREQWEWGNGYYSITDNAEDPNARRILTPAYLVALGIGQTFTSGFECLASADELGEICEELYTKMLETGLTGPATPGSTAGGYYGMTQSSGGLGSYFSQMVGQSSGGVVDEARNVAFNILITARQTEAAILAALDAARGLIANAINRLRNTEKTCWEVIAYNTIGPHVCSAPPVNNSCTATDGSALTIATSTQFSDAAINSSSIGALDASFVQNAQRSVQILQNIDQLLAKVASSDPATQRDGVAQTDALAAQNSRLPACAPQKTLHDPSEVQCAEKQRSDVETWIGFTIDDIITAWGTSPTANVGWCNINNAAVITAWTNCWKGNAGACLRP